jgi:hypothetical protein
MTPMMITSISHARKRSPQNASLSAGTSGVVDTAGATGAAEAAEVSSIATAVPHTMQYFAPSGSSFPHFLQ